MSRKQEARTVGWQVDAKLMGGQHLDSPRHLLLDEALP